MAKKNCVKWAGDPSDHYLNCDACELVVEIKNIDTTYVKG